MSYYVIGGDGQRYGPEEIPTLIQWVHEGRIVRTTALIESASGRQLAAGELPVLAQILPRSEPAAAPFGVSRPCVYNVGQREVVPPYRALNDLPGPKSKIAAGLLGIFLGGFGIHRFYLGYVGVGLFQLILSVVTCGIAYAVVHIWGLIEGILCLTGSMRDAEGRLLRD